MEVRYLRKNAAFELEVCSSRCRTISDRSRYARRSLAMMRAIREYHDVSGGVYRVGYKPAGGISTAKDALTYLAMVKDELGDTWLNNDMFRFGASSLLNDCERQLHHNAFGEYAADYYMPSA